MIHVISLGATLAAFWLSLSGPYSASPLIAGFGVLSVIVALLVGLRMDSIDGLRVPIRFSYGLFKYLLWLGKEIGKANIDVAKIVLAPELKISPRLVRVKATQKTDVGLTIFANSITLTPGTVTVEIEGDEFLVHAITEEMAVGCVEGDMGDRVTAIEGK